MAMIARWLGHKTVEMVIRHYGRWVGEPRERSYGLTELWSVSNAVHM
ncbi:hypothetical protein [Rhodoferax sp.]